MIEKRKFKQLLNGAFIEGGFQRSGKSLIREGADSTLVIGFQKSDFDEKYYINFGIWLKRLGPISAHPKPNQCHLNLRLSAIFPEEVRTIEEGGRTDSSSYENLEKLIELIQKEFIPFSTDCLDEKMLRIHFSSGRLQKGLILAAARKLLQES
ncbi:MAG TPA: DUF4304 domain-containing protein [Burkholderiales bacterium]|jgi:hypothetical protein